MSSRSARRWPVMLGSAAAIALLAAAVPVASGYQYTFRMASRTTDDKGTVKEDTPMLATVQVAGAKARIDFQEAGREQQGGMFSKGTYMIADRGARMVILVDPKEKSYAEMPVDAIGQAMGSMIGGMGKMLKIKVSNAKFSTQDLGAGESVGGFATRHYRVVHDYDMDVQVAWMKSNTSNHTEADYWVNPEISALPNPIFEMFASVGSALVASDAEFVRDVKVAMDKMFKGVPVKAITRTTSIDKKGKKTESVSTMEMLNITRANVPDAVFAIPAGYTKAEPPKDEMAAGAPGGVPDYTVPSTAPDSAQGADSAAAQPSVKDAAKDAAKEVGKEAAKEAAKKKLRGMFKRP